MRLFVNNYSFCCSCIKSAPIFGKQICHGRILRTAMKIRVWKAATFCSSAKSDQGRELRILFFGSDAFSVGPLRSLISRLGHKNDQESKKNWTVCVVTSESPQLKMEKKKQKHHTFMEYVKKENLQFYHWNKESVSKMKGYDFGVVASFGHLIPKSIIQNFKKGMINAHPSLLPRWRGAAPIIHTILNGDVKAGVTIIELSIDRFDRGSIFDQKETEIDETWTSEILTEKLSELAGNMVVDVIENYEAYNEKKYTQPESGASYAPKISKEMSYIRWEKHTCDQINRLYRAIGSKVCLHTFWNGKLVKLVEIDASKRHFKETNDMKSYTPGQAWFDKQMKKLYIKCLDGWILVSKLQVEYKKVIKAFDFYNAYMFNRKSKEIVCNKFHSHLRE